MADFRPGFPAGVLHGLARTRTAKQTVSNDDANEFVVCANHDGKTASDLSPSTIRRVASYLTGASADDRKAPHDRDRDQQIARSS